MNIFKMISLATVFVSLTACGYQTSKIRVGETHTEVAVAATPGFMLKNALGGTAKVYLMGGGLLAEGINYGDAPRQVLVKPTWINGAETMNIMVDITSGGEQLCIQQAVLRTDTPVTWIILKPSNSTRQYNSYYDAACTSVFAVGQPKRGVLGGVFDGNGAVSIGVGAGYGGSVRRKGRPAW